MTHKYYRVQTPEEKAGTVKYSLKGILLLLLDTLVWPFCLIYFLSDYETGGCPDPFYDNLWKLLTERFGFSSLSSLFFLLAAVVVWAVIALSAVSLAYGYRFEKELYPQKHHVFNITVALQFVRVPYFPIAVIIMTNIYEWNAHLRAGYILFVVLVLLQIPQFCRFVAYIHAHRKGIPLYAEEHWNDFDVKLSPYTIYDLPGTLTLPEGSEHTWFWVEDRDGASKYRLDYEEIYMFIRKVYGNSDPGRGEFYTDMGYYVEGRWSHPHKGTDN